MSCPDPYRPYDPSEQAASPDAELKIHSVLPSDAEVRGLTTALAGAGGGLSAKDLALDLVLNQIVEQACLATGATGAAIALTRDGEMVCRATTGRNAPDLGVRLDNAGFSAECLRVGTLQRCDDTETDPRVDAMACRLLGVRSILVIPLWYWGEFMGIFEIFSPRASAFGERDEQTLQALAYRIVRQAKQATGTITGFPASSEEVAVTAPVEPEPEPVTGRKRPKPLPIFELESLLRPARQDRDPWMTALAAVAVLVASAIVGLMIWRVGWDGASARKSVVSPPTVEASTAPAPPPAELPHEEILTLGSLAPPRKTPTRSGDLKIAQASKRDSIDTAAPLGGLAIYDQDNKLIYGTPLTDQSVEKKEPPKPVVPKPLALAPRPQSVAKAMLPKSEAPGSVNSRFLPLNPEVAENLLIDRVEPEYPDAARRARVQGSVTMETLIGSDGRVQRVSPIGGNSQLADAATAAVRQWRYKPYVVNGRKVPVRTQVTVAFMLAQ
jgi:TonB family protein